MKKTQNFSPLDREVQKNDSVVWSLRIFFDYDFILVKFLGVFLWDIWHGFLLNAFIIRGDAHQTPSLFMHSGTKLLNSLALLINPWANVNLNRDHLGDRGRIFFAACKRHCFLWMTQHWIWITGWGRLKEYVIGLKTKAIIGNHLWFLLMKNKCGRDASKAITSSWGWPPKKTAAARSAKESPKRPANGWVCLRKPGRIWRSHQDAEKLREVRKNGTFLDISQCIGRNYKILFNDFTPQKRWTTQTKLPKLRGHVSQKNHGILKSTVLISQNPGHSTLMVFSTLETLSWSEPNPFLAHVCEAVKRAITNSPSRYVVDTPGLNPEETERKYWNWLVKFVDLHCNLPIISNHGDLVEHKNFIYQCDHFSLSFGFKGRYLRHQRHWSWFWDLHVLVERVSSQSSQIGSFFFGWGDFFGLKNQQDQDTWSWRWWPSVSAI